MLNKIKEIFLRINFTVIIMDLLIVSSPFWSIEFFGPSNSYYFAGFSVAWIFLNIYKNKVNKQRYWVKYE